MIYFIQAAIIGRIKIGYSSRSKFDRRLAELQTGSPLPLTLLASIHGSRKTEQELHARFAEYRVLGEWFEPGQRLVRFIARAQGRTMRRAADRPRHVNRAQHAADWLTGLFRRQREWTSGDLWREARAAQVSRRAIFQAKELLALPRPRFLKLPSGDTGWLWWVPADWPPLAEPVGMPAGPITPNPG